MNAHDVGDSWFGPLGMWVWTIGNWLFGGVSGIHVMLMIATLFWTVIKTLNEIDKRRLAREFRERQQTSPHPLRRKSDLPNLDTKPGVL